MKLNKSATEICASLTESYGDATLSSTVVLKWHKLLKRVEKMLKTILVLEDQSRPQMEYNVEVVRAVMAKDRRLSARMIAEETGLDKYAVHIILTDHLDLRKLCTKLVPKNLSVEQKANQLEICQELLGRLEIEPDFLDKIKTGDES